MCGAVARREIASASASVSGVSCVFCGGVRGRRSSLARSRRGGIAGRAGAGRRRVAVVGSSCVGMPAVVVVRKGRAIVGAEETGGMGCSSVVRRRGVRRRRRSSVGVVIEGWVRSGLVVWEGWSLCCCMLVVRRDCLRRVRAVGMSVEAHTVCSAGMTRAVGLEAERGRTVVVIQPVAEAVMCSHNTRLLPL